MAPTKSKQRASDQSETSTRQRSVKVPVKDGPTTPTERSPIKKRRAGITLQQKKTLIENLQLEVTERARRLRAQYHLQAQGLRSRIEIRINRIPTALRKMKMGDLLLKYIHQEQQAAIPPPVPPKDVPLARTAAQKQNSRPTTARSNKRLSTEMTGGDKENEFNGEAMKKRGRAAVQDGTFVRPAQILSPTSSNSRLLNRDNTASPTKSYLSRPGSPLKGTGARSAASATSMLSSMVEKAKAARAASARKVTGSSNANTRTAPAPASVAKTRHAPAKQQPTRPATRTGRRVSAHSETSEGSNGTVVRKTTASKASTAATKKSVIGSIRKGVANTRATAPTTSSSGRVLRKRT